ncbi:hypothetical protein DL98DRAFT_66271 [Cadophora sp. DSE1049]|nr:hypothetical protein DL98DRAFT_66271 [Cadophora sp. DSE1049]
MQPETPPRLPPTHITLQHPPPIPRPNITQLPNRQMPLLIMPLHSLHPIQLLPRILTPPIKNPEILKAVLLHLPLTPHQALEHSTRQHCRISRTKNRASPQIGRPNVMQRFPDIGREGVLRVPDERVCFCGRCPGMLGWWCRVCVVRGVFDCCRKIGVVGEVPSACGKAGYISTTTPAPTHHTAGFARPSNV